MKTKKRKPYDVKPAFRKGDSVLLRGEQRTILRVYPGRGNRSMYQLDGRGWIFSESYLHKP